MASAKTTTDHETIQQWVEERGGNPARVKSTGKKNDPGILRIDYPGFSGSDTLEAIDWDTFFEAFEQNGLAFLYQDQPDSRFSKFIARGDEAEQEEQEEDEEAIEEVEEVEAIELDAIELLESQHREVEGLFDQLREASDKSGDKAGNKRERKRLFVELADNLAAHAKIEEKLFYPAVCDEDTTDQLHEAVDEHLDVKRLVAELLETDVDDQDFTAKLEELEQLVSHHVDEEENNLFVQVRAQEQVDLEELATQLEQQFTKLMQSQPRKQIPNELDGPADLPC